MHGDSELRKLVEAIVSGPAALASRLLSNSPDLATAHFRAGATRQQVREHYLEAIGRYVIAEDTALHIAAAAHRTEVVEQLIGAGADVQARNRFGDQPLHAAAVGFPGSLRWNPSAQAATIRCLIQAGANPNAVDKRGVSPLHRAVRTRSSAAVRALLECGADPTLKNNSGSTPMRLASKSTGRGGVGSPAAKMEQAEILRLLSTESLGR